LPFYSDLGLPIEKIKKYTFSLEGFVVPRAEILLILKQIAFEQRKGSIKGEKDKIDIICLLSILDLDFDFYKKILRKYNQKNLQKELSDLISELTEIKELGLNKHKYSKFKKRILEKLN
jgi:virulence-associated protein VapD